MKDRLLEQNVAGFALLIGLSSYAIWAGGLLGKLKETLFICTPIFFIGVAVSIFIAAWFLINKQILTRRLSLFLLVVISFNLIAAFSPFIEVDSLAYHLYLPKTFLKANTIYLDKYSGNTLFPLLFDLLFTIGVMLKNISICNVLVFLTAIFLILAVISFVINVVGNKKYVPYAVLIVLSMPIFLLNSVISYTDVAAAFFVFLSVYFFIRWTDGLNIRYLYLTGIFSGFGIATKHVGLLAVVIISGMFFYECIIRRGNLKCFSGSILLYFSMVFLCGGWWYIRAFIVSGNPFYPYLYEIFGPKGWHSDIAGQVGMGKGLWQYITGLWNMNIHAAKFGGGADQTGIIGVCFLPSVFFAWRKFSTHEKNAIVYLGIFTVLFYTLWFLTIQQFRFFYPAGITLGLICAISLTKTLERKGLFEKLIKTIFILFLCVNFSLIFYYQLKRIAPVFAADKREFLLKNSRTYGIAEWVNKNIPEDAKIFLCDDPAIFYFDPYITRETTFRYVTEYDKKGMTESGIREMLIREKFYYIILVKRSSPDGKMIDSYFANAVSRLIPEKGPGFVELIHKEMFSNTEAGTYEYYVYKLK